MSIISRIFGSRQEFPLDPPSEQTAPVVQDRGTYDPPREAISCACGSSEELVVVDNEVTCGKCFRQHLVDRYGYQRLLPEEEA